MSHERKSPLSLLSRNRSIARNTAALLDPSLHIPDSAIILDDRFHAGIYGIPGPGTISAMKLCARQEAVITDPVYVSFINHNKWVRYKPTS